MQARFLVATLVVLLALVSAKWTWVEDDNTTVAPADGDGPAHDKSAETFHQGSLSAHHQEAKDADSLLKSLFKKLSQQIADDFSATVSKIESRTDSMKFDDAATAKAYLDGLTNQQTALNKEMDEPKTVLATEQSEKSVEQEAIDKENAEQKARLTKRIAVVEKQIALIKQILALLSFVPIDQTLPESVILDDTQARLITTFFANTSWADKKYVRCYRASENQYSALEYNNQCNGKAGLLTIVKSSTGNIFGGFTSVPLDGSGNYKQDDNAFLYSVVRSGQTNLVKLLHDGKHNNDAHTADILSNGPTFQQDLHVAHQCNENSNSLFYINYNYWPNLVYTYTPSSYVYTGPNGYYTGHYDYDYYAGINHRIWSYETPHFTCADYEVFHLV